ncbi:MAG: hypothetical protein NVS1B10_08110 [Candidatus Saccharimonadales bacterium]
MKRTLNVNQVLKNFIGENIQVEGTEKDLTLKDALLSYLRVAHMMGIGQQEEGIAYSLGFIIGPSSGDVELSTDQYDLLKKICDNGKVKSPNGTEQSVWSLEVKGQAKALVDAASPKEDDILPASS